MTTKAEFLISERPQTPALLRAVLLSVTAVLLGAMAGRSSGGSSPTTTTAASANQIFVIGQTNALDIRSTTDGHLISEIQSPQIDPSVYMNSWWRLATDGSYICAGTPTGLAVWSSTGQQLFTRPGTIPRPSHLPPRARSWLPQVQQARM